VLSVTSDVTVSATYQNAPPKPALPDPSQLTSSFAAMVDSNLPAAPQNSPPSDPAQPPPRAAQDSARQDSARQDSPRADTTPRDTASSDKSQPRAADNSRPDDNDRPPPSDSSKAASGNDASKRSGGANSDDSKSITSDSSKKSESKSTDKAGTDADSAADALDSAVTPQATDQPTATPDPIAALIPVVPALANPPSTPGTANAPLAIAAAAIAASSATANAVTGFAIEGKTGEQAGTQKTQSGVPNTKTQTQTTALPTPAAQQTAATGTTLATDVALTSAAGTQGATSGKTTGVKTTTGFETKSVPSAATGNAQGGKDASSTVATTDQTNAAQLSVPKPDVQVTPPNAVKAESDGGSTPGQATHDHSQLTPNAQPAPAVADANAQLAAVSQQQFSTATPTGATDKFTVTHAAGPAVPLSGLAVEIAASVQSGKTHFEVRLDPADLGRIDVRIDVDRNGQVTSHLTVEKPETLSMLQQDAPQLQQALTDAGLKTSNGGLQFSLRDHSQSGQNSNSNNNQAGAQSQRLVISEEDTVPAAIAGRSYGRMLGNSGGVDIRV
jgi:flagellar hook-length control protein FliK